MKAKSMVYCLLGLALVLTGCWQKSVYPFYLEKDVEFEPELLGVWKDAEKEGDDGARWTFERGDGVNAYRVKVVDGETKLDLDGRLFQLDGRRHLDLYSRSRTINEIPAHHLLRVAGLEKGTLNLEILNVDWVQSYLRENPEALAHVRSRDPEHPGDRDKDEIILTASTDLLQKFVLKHAKDEKFFAGMSALKKVESK